MKTTKILITMCLAVLLAGTNLNAQVTIGSQNAPNASSVLDLQATNKGLLLPRVALTGINSPLPLSAHVQGMLVYNTAIAGTGNNEVIPGQYYNDGTKWVQIAQVTSATNIFGSGAPTGSCSANTIYTDTLKTSSTVGQQWTCSGGGWVAYKAPNATEWYVAGTTNDAGNNKVTGISRDGYIVINSTSGLHLKASPGTGVGSDHVYMNFYARAATPNVRSGWFGYGSRGIKDMAVSNEIGNLFLSAKDSVKSLRTFVTPLLVANYGPGAIQLKAGINDHTYISFFARTATPDMRSGYIGYGSSGQTALNIYNEITNGNVNIYAIGTGNINLITGTGYTVASRLQVNGILKVGNETVTTPVAGMIRFNGTNFQGYNGTAWVNF